ncbi:signal recognition particle SRP9 SRP14 subunit [Coniophora puteana RWD-64-598 SS2]|uniref:Signal recognition particle subunit SRP14 n=1 Tax=Coniophora puteana (strain RWD-64-598) TaxID=741705 RepID=A0A5M3N8A7_CONPW|nr:signal recognition particle SRP9 SRP14 subunit [Coniophora puteana RWD-64-598 SS2]EIW87344.1 signal recognition particle SRP9 SRP14 subunit [Coniophora puteana RWD-64-598 SS2]
MSLVDNDAFLERLKELFDATKERGAVWLTHKRLNHDGEDAIVNDEDSERLLILRVTDGKKTKFSTKIHPDHLTVFHAAYGNILKASMTTLRKRDKKREKQRAESIAAKKARTAKPVVIDGPKRGKGRRKRQRKVKAALKQEEMKERQAKREEAREKAAASAAAAGES